MATLVPQTVFTKTAKGILEIRNKSTRLPRELSTVLEHVDGTASVADLQPRSGLADAQFHHALNTLVGDGYIKVVASPAAAAPARDPSAVQFDSPDEVARLNMELAAHALASAEATKLAQQEGRAALDARLRAEAEARALALAESRLQAESAARATADAAARAAQHARDNAEQKAASATDPAARGEAQAEAKAAATAALRSRAEAQARAEAEDRARALVDEKKRAERHARDEAQAHADAEQRAQQRVAAESRAREALQAQIDAAAAVRSHDDAAARAKLHESEEAAGRARLDAEALAQAQGVKTEASTENLHFDDLAQKLTARVHAERRAREEAARKPHTPEPAAQAPVATKDGFPPLEFVPSGVEAPQAATGDTPAAALPDIDMSSGAGRGDVKHNTPDHVPSALERAMMEREARAQAESKANGGAQPATTPSRTVTTTSGREATTLTARAPQSTYESKREAAAAAAAPAVFTPKVDASSEKVTPTLADDEPVSERLNVDRAAHDILAESAEDRRKSEVAALSRQAADLRRQRQEEEARRVAREQSERKRRTTGRAAALVLVGAPLLAIAWLQFVPLNGYIPEAQEALSARLNQPTTVSTVRYVLLPTPRIVLEGVRIGSAQAVHVERVEARSWPVAFVAGPLEFSTVEASGVTIDPGMLATIPAWTGGRSASAVHVSRLKLSGVKLGGPDAKMEGMTGEIVFAANGTVSHATLANEKVTLEVSPLQSGVLVALSARDWRVPFGPAVTFSYLTLEGIADKQRFATTQLSGRIGGGAVTGTLAARWEGPTIVGGELKIAGARIDEAVQQLAPHSRVKGVLTSNLRYAMQADSASGLMEKAMVEGTFLLARGELGGIDLARAVQLPGTPTGGRTVFEELKGSVQLTGDRYSFRNLQLQSGPLEATGAVDIAPGGQLSGRIDAQMTARSTVVGRSSFTVRGTVKEPQLAR